MAIPTVTKLLDLSGKVALVTGASQGIGAGIAQRLAEAGAAVGVHYRSREQAAAAVVASITAGGGRAIALQGELNTPAAVEALMARTQESLGALDIAVNNAGRFSDRSLLDMAVDDWRAIYADNVETAFLCTQAAGRRMRAAGGGSIVNIASIDALTPAPLHGHYSSAKAAVVMLTRSAAREFGAHGIRVNAVSPGLVDRPGLEEQWPDGVASFLSRVPLARLGQPEDVADACLFLASGGARWISGHNLIVDGGIMSAEVF